MEWDMDLNLNLGPLSPPSLDGGPDSGPPPGDGVNLDAWVSEPPLRVPPAVRFRTTRQRYRSRNLQLPVESSIPLHWLVDPEEPVGGPSGLTGGGPMGEDGGGGGGGGGGVVQDGEGSVAREGEGEGEGEEVAKTCENHVSLVEDGSGDDEGELAEKKTSSEEGSFFDCNICLDLAQEPVVTCCGHLFCWRCIYSWLHVHSDTRECPVCKGEVTDKTLIPIYGRGNHTRISEDDSGEKIPARPSAKRVESIRQTIQRAASSFTLEEIIRRVGARFDDFFQLPNNNDGNREMLDRSFVLSRILASRAMRREQNRAVPPENIVDLTQDRAETSGQRRLPPLTYRRGQSHRGLEAFLGRSSPVQSQEQQPPSGDDRDSFSSIAAVIHGETISTSSSRQRNNNEASRASDVDSGESRALRRRRLV